MRRQKHLRPRYRGHFKRKDGDAGGFEACVDRFVTGGLRFRVAQPSSLLTWPGERRARDSVGKRHLDLVAKETAAQKYVTAICCHRSFDRPEGHSTQTPAQRYMYISRCLCAWAWEVDTSASYPL